MPRAFDADTVRLLDEIEEIDIESGAPGVRRTIWVVVVDSEVYIRSVNGERGQWYQAVRARPDGFVHAGDRTIPAQAVHVTDPAIITRVTDEYLRKYAASEWAPPMAEPHTLNTTLRLEPR